MAAVEFAASLPLLLLILGGIVDFGMLNFYQGVVAQVTALGAQYAVVTGSTVNPTNVQNLVQNATGVSGITASVTGPACYCITSSPSIGLTSAACGATCSDGSAAGSYIILSTNYTYTPMLLAANLLPVTVISRTATVALQ